MRRHAGSIAATEREQLQGGEGQGGLARSTVARPQGASPEAGSATFNVALEAWGRGAGTETETSEAEKETQKGRAVEKGEMKREGEMQGGESGKHGITEKQPTKQRREVSTGPCSSFCIEISFIIFL